MGVLTDFLNSDEYVEAKYWREQEYEAWGKVVAELRKLGVEINDQETLNGLLFEWASIRRTFINKRNISDKLQLEAEKKDKQE